MKKNRFFSGLLHRLALVRLVACESVKDFLSNNGFEFSATLAYYGFLSLMPLLLLVFFLLGLFMRSSDAILSAMDGLARMAFPAFSREILDDLITLTAQKTWGVVGVVLLLWSIVPFAGTVRYAMRKFFQAEQKRNFMINKLFDFAAVLGLLTLFIALVAGKIYYGIKEPVISAKVGFVSSYADDIVAPLLVIAALVFFYLVFSPVRMRFRELFAGVFTAALLLTVMRPFFGWFLKYNPEYGYAFGSLKTIFLVLIWFYYTFVVILFGAVVSSVLRRREALLLKGLFHGAHLRAGALSRLLLNKLTRTYWKDENVFVENEPGQEMYFVVEGGVDLIKEGMLIKRVVVGEYFGEMSMLLKVPRTATARVISDDTRLIAINAGNFTSIMRENPDIVLALLKELADRLRDTDAVLIAAAGRQLGKR